MRLKLASGADSAPSGCNPWPVSSVYKYGETHSLIEGKQRMSFANGRKSFSLILLLVSILLSVGLLLSVAAQAGAGL